MTGRQRRGRNSAAPARVKQDAALVNGLLSRPEALTDVRGFKKQSEVTVDGPYFVQEVSPDAIGRALAKWTPTLR